MYEIITVHRYKEKITVDPLSHMTWDYREWCNDTVGIKLREVHNIWGQYRNHVVVFKKDKNGEYKEISKVDYNQLAQLSKTKLASLM